jgi:chromosome segregation ATPase
MSVTREKYDSIRNKAHAWKDKCGSLQEDLEDSKNCTDDLAKQNKILQKALKIATSSSATKVVKAEDGFSRERLKLETELILKDGEVRRLQASLEDTKESLKELKEDNRELRKALREK